MTSRLGAAAIAIDGQAESCHVLARAVLPPEPWSDGALTWLGRTLDRVAMRGMRLAFAAALRPSEAELEAARGSVAPYVTADLTANPRRFFQFLDARPDVDMHELRRRTVAGGVIVSREFRTRYEPYHSGANWPVCAENDRVPVEHWMHRDGSPRATVLALHGFTMGSPWVDARVLLAARWFSLGFDVALLALPFHGPRSPRTARYSGELFASWDVSRTNEAVRQAVHDIHLVRSWIASETRRPVGLLGLSLGGYLSALMGGLCDDLAFVVPLVPPAFLDALASSLLALGGPARVAQPPIPFDQLRSGYAVHCPLTYPLAVPRERVLIVGARGDCLVPPAHAYTLWRHWGEPEIYWYSGSHTAPFRRARLVARIQAHIEGLDL